MFTILVNVVTRGAEDNPFPIGRLLNRITQTPNKYSRNGKRFLKRATHHIENVKNIFKKREKISQKGSISY